MCAKYLEYETKLIHLQLMRITPADAGKTAKRELKAAQKADHPRGCGENALGKTRITVAMGSPPRMRGKLEKPCMPENPYGITPADAGKTYASANNSPIPRDHPRGCGENVFSPASVTSRQGSPPRMRGKPKSTSAPKARSRITPAGAGKTKMSCCEKR